MEGFEKHINTNQSEQNESKPGSKENSKEDSGNNPNSIGELLSISKDIETSPGNVYRSVMGFEAIDDLAKSGIVRNKQAARGTTSRWGEKVFWSKGENGKYHTLQEGGYVIEAPSSKAEEERVTLEDVTAIYTKNENGDVINIIDEVKGPLKE